MSYLSHNRQYVRVRLSKRSKSLDPMKQHVNNWKDIQPYNIYLYNSPLKNHNTSQNKTENVSCCLVLKSTSDIENTDDADQNLFCIKTSNHQHKIGKKH